MTATPCKLTRVELGGSSLTITQLGPQSGELGTPGEPDAWTFEVVWAAASLVSVISAAIMPAPNKVARIRANAPCLCLRELRPCSFRLETRSLTDAFISLSPCIDAKARCARELRTLYPLYAQNWSIMSGTRTVTKSVTTRVVA